MMDRHTWIVRMIVLAVAAACCTPLSGAAAPRKQGPSKQQKQFKQLLEQLQQDPLNDALREKVIRQARTLKPAPAVPEEARRPLVRGNVVLGAAKSAEDHARAIDLYEEALATAPWWKDPYFQLAKAQELQKDYDEAIRSLKFYLLTGVSKKEARQAQDHIYALEEKRDALKKASDTNRLDEQKKREAQLAEERKKREAEQWEAAKAAAGLVFVKGGCFRMGVLSADHQIYLKTGEGPVHEVCVDDFYMGKHEVTQKQWAEIMGYNPSVFKGCDDCPVEYMTWSDVQAFVSGFNQKTGRTFRLPTEAEWEYAARSGGHDETWAGTSRPGELGAFAWTLTNSGQKSHLVGQKRPNGLGLFDMSGNVWELCQDWYDQAYYKSSPRDNPKGPASGSSRAIRGGSWYDPEHAHRTSKRAAFTKSGTVGFRLVLPAAGQQ